MLHYLKGLSPKALGKAQCSHEVTQVTDKSKKLFLHITDVSVLLWIGSLLESEEKDSFSAYFLIFLLLSVMSLEGSLLQPRAFTIRYPSWHEEFQPVSPVLEGLQLGLD